MESELDVASNCYGVGMHFVLVSVMVDDFVGVRLDDRDQVVDGLDRQVVANRVRAGGYTHLVTYPSRVYRED